MLVEGKPAVTTTQTREPIVDIGQLIVTSPSIRHNRPRISGTGVTVQRIIILYKSGLSPEEIADEFGHLSLAQVYALASQGVRSPQSALEIATRQAAHGMSIKLSTCGGILPARQIDAIARAARMTTMVGCLNEPALLIAAGLALALSSPNVQYGDLDGHFDLIDDPTVPGFRFEEGWLIASDVPGLGCRVDL